MSKIMNASSKGDRPLTPHVGREPGSCARTAEAKRATAATKVFMLTVLFYWLAKWRAARVGDDEVWFCCCC